MLQMSVSVVSLQKGSIKAVSATGTTSMSDSLMATQPRILEPSKPRPSSKVCSSRASAGMVKCCHKPGKSMKRRSTARISFSRIRARISRGVMTRPSPVGQGKPLRNRLGNKSFIAKWCEELNHIGEKDKETRRQGDKETKTTQPISLSPCLLVSLSPCLFDLSSAKQGGGGLAV